MKYNELASTIKGPVFSRNDLVMSGHKVLDYQLSLWVKKGYLIRLKNGLYIRLNEEEMEKTLDREKFLKYLEVFGVKKMEKWVRRCLL